MRRNFEVQAEEEAEAERRKDREDEDRAEREEIMASRNEIGEVPDMTEPPWSIDPAACLYFGCAATATDPRRLNASSASSSPDGVHAKITLTTR